MKNKEVPCKNCGVREFLHPEKNKPRIINMVPEAFRIPLTGYPYSFDKCPGFEKPPQKKVRGVKGVNIPPHIWM